jgi:hypothetical protein
MGDPALRNWVWLNFGWDIYGIEWADDDLWF